MKRSLIHRVFSVGLFCLIISNCFNETVAQSNNHWSQNFNEESSLLSGAVVGGGAGAAAIYYNPATISETKESKISLNASLFAFEYLNSKNTFGEDIDLYYPRGVVVPRFISYMIKPKNHPGLSLEIAFLNNEDYLVENTRSVDQNLDILTNHPGNERYNTFYEYRNKYRDDWVGIGGSVRLNENLYLGASMFTSVRTVAYKYSVDIAAVPDPSSGLEQNIAHYSEHNYANFNDYRLLGKLGLLYKKDQLSLGINFTSPSIGNIYSNRSEVSRKKSYQNISDPSDGTSIPDMLIADFMNGKNVTVNAKSPLSVGAGMTWTNKNKDKTVYLTGEYFAGIDAHRMVQASENSNIASGTVSTAIDYNEWLTFISGAKPVYNIGLGFRWIAAEKVMILSGFRTDYNFRKDMDFGDLNHLNSFKHLNMNRYHLTGGTSLNIMGHDLILGIQYTLGNEKNQEQFVSFTDPLEYDPATQIVLQGNIQTTMNTSFNAFTVYFGATINLNRSANDQ